MLTDSQIQSNKTEFLNELSNVKREGIDSLIEWLSSPDPNVCDFFIAPSSASFHGNFKGGLCLHSLNVYKCLVSLREQYYKIMELKGKSDLTVKIPDDSCRVTALLHDLCKVNFYKEADKWYKDENNMWQKYTGYSIEDKFPFGHGEKSVFMIQRFMNVNGAEALAIRWHMGTSEIATQLDNDYKFAFSKAWDICPLAYLLHQADSMASFLLEDKVEAPNKH